MIRLGLRLALAGGRGPVVAILLTAAAVAIGTAVLLFALSFAPAATDRDARTAWRDSFQVAADDRTGTLVLVSGDTFAGRPITRVHVAPAGDGAAPPPPGVERLPEPGTAFVSPALAALIAAAPPDQLGDRFGRIVGAVPDVALASPDDLVAVIGREPAALRDEGALAVAAFATQSAPLDLPPIGALIVILAAVGALAPVAVFVATAVRMSAAGRELRLAALRLVGATPAQVARLAVVEALTATAIGALGGVVLFAAVRPVVARIPLDDATWWPGAIVPPLPAAIGLLVAVQIVGAAAALVAMRRLTVTPLGVQRRGARSAPHAVRVVPLFGAVLALLGAVSWYRSDGDSVLPLASAGLAFAAVIAAIVLAGPWLTAVVGRLLGRGARGAATLLAARRLEDEPRGSFGAIAGVIMAVFVASAFFTFAAYATEQSGETSDPLVGAGDLVVHLKVAPGDAADQLLGDVRAIDGVRGATPVREVVLVRDGGIEAFAWVASCPDLAATLDRDAAWCAAGGVTQVTRMPDAGRYDVVSDRSAPEGVTPARVTVTVPAGSVHSRGAPGRPPLFAGGPDFGLLPSVLIDPSALRGALTAAAFPVTRLYVATDGGAEVVERVRTVSAGASPTSRVQTATDRVAQSNVFREIGRIVALGLVGSLALAGCSLAVAVTTATLERRRQFVFLRSAGMPASALRTAILVQASVPLVVVASVSAGLGIVVALAVLWVAGVPEVVVPDPSLLVTFAGSLAVAMGIVALTLPSLERMTRPVSLRHE